MTERENISALFNAAGESAGWKPGIGNDLVLNYLNHFAELVKADFLKSSGQYLTNDASREACIKQAKSEAYEKALNALDPDKYPNECDKSMVHNCKLVIRQLKEQS